MSMEQPVHISPDISDEQQKEINAAYEKNLAALKASGWKPSPPLAWADVIQEVKEFFMSCLWKVVGWAVIGGVGWLLYALVTGKINFWKFFGVTGCILTFLRIAGIYDFKKTKK